MSDPQHFGLGELGQRVQAMSDPAPEPRLRPYKGAPLPIGSAINGSPLPAADHGPGPYEDVRIAPPTANPFSSPFSSYSGSTAKPAAPQPFTAPVHSTSAANGYTSPNIAPAESSSESAASQTAPPIAPLAPADPNSAKTGLQRAVHAVRSALPLVQRLLPLLEGNLAGVLGALMAPQPGNHPTPHVQVDLEPVERGLAEVRTSNRELKTQVQEQGATLKRVEDQLDRVREATDRNTLEQQELVEDLRAVGTRMSTFAIIGILLLAISLGLNIYFLIQLQHILR
jgi:hypothetical protein